MPVRGPWRILCGLIALPAALAAQLPTGGDSLVAPVAAATPNAPLFGANRLGIAPHQLTSLPDTGPRPRAIEYSDAYAVRLTIHRWASYAELPLFAAEWIVGQKLITQQRTTNIRHSSLKSAHNALAGSLGILFGINTITGIWNLADSWNDPAGRTRRLLHSIGMLAADAGFFYTASLGGDARETNGGVTNHRNAALVSMGIATASTLMMWLWKQ